MSLSLSKKIILFLFLFSSSTAVFADAQIYKWTDDEGKVHFSDNAPDSLHTEPVSLEVNSYTFPKIKAKKPYKPSTKGNQVILYSTTWCGYCKKARKYFRKNNILFIEYDIEKNAKGKRDYKKMNGRGVPIILVGKQRMNGFSAQRFMQLYKG